MTEFYWVYFNFWVSTMQFIKLYMDADKSLAQPDKKKNWKVAIFHPTQRSLLPWRPGWKDNLLNFFWVACKSQRLVAVTCFLPGRA